MFYHSYFSQYGSFKLLDRFLLKTEKMRIAKELLEGKIYDELEYFKDARSSGS